MKISVIGCGYLGAVHAAGMASLGHEVVGVDVDEAKVAALSEGVAPFHEPGFPELLSEQVAAGRLRFTTDMAAVAEAQVHFIGVGTPQQKGSHAADLQYVNATVSELCPHLRDGALVVGKSTVPVGTARRLRSEIQAAQPSAELIWNPEFLREGFAIKDTLTPDRIVYGVSEQALHEEGASLKSVVLLDEVYQSIIELPTQRLIVGLETAELVKVAANAFLATKISFINAMAEICESTGGDVTELADAIGLDERIGRRYLNSGLGFGGGCLPKDIRAFQARAEELGRAEPLRFLAEVDAINTRRRERVVELVAELTNRTLEENSQPLAGVTVALWGLAFKPNSDDIRDLPALDVARRLLEAGAYVQAHDPQAMQNAQRQLPRLATCPTPLEATRNADILILGTEWNVYRDANPAQVKTLIGSPRLIDGRNYLDRSMWAHAGWVVRCLGRPDLTFDQL